MSFRCCPLFFKARVFVLLTESYFQGAIMSTGAPVSIHSTLVRDAHFLLLHSFNTSKQRLDPDDRTPDPERLLRYLIPLMSRSKVWLSLLLLCIPNTRRAYFYSATTLNHVRALLTSGFASLHHPRDWSLAHVRSPSLRCVYTSNLLILSFKV